MFYLLENLNQMIVNKIIYTIVSLVLIRYNVVAQRNPKLPPNYFNKFSYSLPHNFDHNDSLQVVSEVYKIAAEINKWHTAAQKDYSFSDTSALYAFLDRTITTNALLNNSQQVIDAIYTCRLLEETKPFSAPYRLSQLAYSKACLLHTDDAGKAFKNIYAKELLQQYNLIDPAFRNDILNRQKGITTPGIAQRYWKNLIRLFEYTVNKTNGKLKYNTAEHDIIPAYYSYNLLTKYQPLLDSVLYVLSPSIIKTLKENIAMRDGIKLKAVIYRDSMATTTMPAIVAVNPYPSGGADASKGSVFATNGYVYVYVDARGRGESDGNFIPFENDAQDLYDIIDWVSKQSWCNGKVATTGGSYLGFAQWQSIRKEYKHPALKAINPMVSVGFGIDFPMEGNMFYSFVLPWAVYVTGKQPNHALYNDTKFWNGKYYEHYKKQLPFSKLDSVAVTPNAIFQKWLSHPYLDNYWQSILPSPADYKAIDIPILSITGYYDGDQTGAMYYYNQHQQHGSSRGKQNHYLLIGPYDHGGAQWMPENIQGGFEIESNAQIPIYKYAIWWFDWVLKGKKKPTFLKNRITYFETGNNAWNGVSSFKQLTSDSLELYLSNKSIANPKRKSLFMLDTKQPGLTDEIKYTHDISAPLDSMYLFSSSRSVGDSIYMSSSHNLIFESEPLLNDITISDRIVSKIYASLNVPDADFEVSIREIVRNGKEHKLANGRIRVRYRNGARQPELVKLGEVVLLSIQDVHLYIKKVSKGSKIRLIFQSVNNPWNEKNWGFGGEVSKESTTDPRVIRATIHIGKQYKSKIIIPYK
jgi:uncharacterized protein